MPDAGDKVTIENIASPGKTYRVHRAKYTAMREALRAARRLAGIDRR